LFVSLASLSRSFDVSFADYRRFAPACRGAKGRLARNRRGEVTCLRHRRAAMIAAQRSHGPQWRGCGEGRVIGSKIFAMHGVGRLAVKSPGRTASRHDSRQAVLRQRFRLCLCSNSLIADFPVEIRDAPA